MDLRRVAGICAQGKLRQLTYKPGSVGPCFHDAVTLHLWRPLLDALMQPTRMIWPRNRLELALRVIPIWSCSRWCLPCGPCYQAPGALLPHPFILTGQKAGGLLSVALSLGSPPAAVSRHRVSMEPGLSSSMGLPPCQRPPGQLARDMCWTDAPASSDLLKHPPWRLAAAWPSAWSAPDRPD